jgi:hypothetical protein
MFVFQIATEDTDKQAFLKILCRNVASTMCRPDPDTFLRQMKAEDLGLEPSDFNVSNFSSTYRTLQKKVSIFFTFMNFQSLSGSLWLRQPTMDLRFDLGISIYGISRCSWLI